jgi:hypothetical protein
MQLIRDPGDFLSSERIIVQNARVRSKKTIQVTSKVEKCWVLSTIAAVRHTSSVLFSCFSTRCSPE